MGSVERVGEEIGSKESGAPRVIRSYRALRALEVNT